MSGGLFSLEGCTVILTGGCGQLGRQFTRALLGHGARVAILDEAAGDEAAVAAGFGEISEHPDLLFVPADVTDRSSIERALQQVEQRWGPPQGLINNAALDSPPSAPVSENGPFETYPEGSWNRVMDVNVGGVLRCCQVVGGRMAECGGGSIVNIGSIYGLVSPDQGLYTHMATDEGPFVKPVAYAASKSALLNLTRYLATYWGAKNVRVNTLTFGGVFNGQDEQFVEGYTARVPLGRMANEDDYNGAIIFLMSRASAYMTGSNMVMDGGWTAW